MGGFGKGNRLRIKILKLWKLELILDVKGFLLSMVFLGGIFFFLKKSDSSSGIEEYYASANGVPMEVTPENVDYTVTYNEAPVIAYFWASW